MLLENTPYTESEAINELLDTDFYYVDRIFTVRKYPIDVPTWNVFYTCVLREVERNGNTELAFVVLCDETFDSFLERFMVIESYEIAEFNIVKTETEVEGNVFDKISPYLTHKAIANFKSRCIEKDGSLMVSVSGANIKIDNWNKFTINE